MSDPNRENQPQDEIGLKLVRRDWTIYDDQTQRMLERMLTCYGEAAAQLMSQAIWLELNLRESAATQCIERLQRQLDDTPVVLHLQEQELARLKATKGRKRIQELEQRCGELEEALARKPVEEASFSHAKRGSFITLFYSVKELIQKTSWFRRNGQVTGKSKRHYHLRHLFPLCLRRQRSLVGQRDLLSDIESQA